MIRTPKKNIFNRACFLQVFQNRAIIDDFFRNRLDQIIDLRYSAAVLASGMPRPEIEASVAQRWAHYVKAGKKIEDLDLFCPVSGVPRWRHLQRGPTTAAHSADGGAAVPQACLQRK